MPVPGYGLLYHYTTAPAAVESILPTGRLRLGLFEFTNDPREAKQWHLSASVAEGVDFEDGALQAMSQTADRLLRRSVKLACFTEDAPPRNDLDLVSGRGFGHSRLWSQYAANHSGVCIGFDRTALLAALAEQLKGRGTSFHAPVEYVEDPSPPYASTHVDVEQVDEFGLDAVIAASVEQHRRELFFTKDLDWASEHEYRFVLLSDEPVPVFIDISDCVRLIVLGDSFPASRLQSVLYAVRSTNGVQVARLHYMNGRPHLLPAIEGSSGSERPYRRSSDLATRTKALLDAAREAAEARVRGARYTAAALSALLEALGRCASKLEALDNVLVALHDSGYAAVPLKERQRAAGVTRSDVVHSGGRMCVVEHQPQYSFTLVASVAAQALTDNRIRLHAALEMERWLVSGNERREVWRGRVEATPEAAADHALALGAEFEQHLADAMSVYEAQRQST